MKFIVENEKETVNKIFELLRDRLKAGFSIGLIGDLGSGKTTLVKGLLEKMGVKEPITSPTFALRKIYNLADKIKIQHIDLYRIANSDKNPEIEEWLEDRSYLTLVEWPENIKDCNKYFDLILFIRPTGENSREIEVVWN